MAQVREKTDVNAIYISWRITTQHPLRNFSAYTHRNIFDFSQLFILLRPSSSSPSSPYGATASIVVVQSGTLTFTTQKPGEILKNKTQTIANICVL